MRGSRPSWTARWVASQRASLAAGRPVRGDADAEARLYRDLALPGLGSRLLAPSGMAVRTEFYDRCVLDAAVRGFRQVVVLGAGYDGRALRFSDSPMRWIEVDHPASQADKRRRLSRIAAPVARVTFVAVDLALDDLDASLDAAGHDTAAPTLWIAEGLLPYLPPPAIRSMLRTARNRSLAGSLLAVNVLVSARTSARGRAGRTVVDGLLVAIGERRLTSFGEGDLEALLEESGWKVEERSKHAEMRSGQSHFLAVLAVY